MRSTASQGDLALGAQPVSPESFAAFGRLLAPGGRAYLGKRGRVLVAVDERRPAPRRVTHLQRYPEAKRALLPVGRTPMWLVVLPPGDAPQGPPTAFLVPGGTGVVLKEGVWHAGPVPLEDTTLCEMLETAGSSDRFDRRSVAELVEREALIVLLPEDPGAPSPSLDLAAPNAVLLDASLHGRLRLACLMLADADLAGGKPGLDDELAQAIAGLRSMWGHATDLGEIPGIALGRDLYREVGIDVRRFVPQSEALIAHVLAGNALPQQDLLERVLALVTLRTRAPIGAYDADRLGDQVLVRTGSDDDVLADAAGRGLPVGGRPVLCGRDGAPFGSPLGGAGDRRPGPTSRRTLVVLYLPPSADAATIDGLLDGTAKALIAHLGGRIDGRLVVG